MTSLPARCALLLCGVPATGKSTFGHYLKVHHGFSHYDLEHHPDGWPCPELKREWDGSRSAFVEAVTSRHARVTLDWGFPVACLPIVRELSRHGVRLIWFDAARDRALASFRARCRGREEDFHKQVSELEASGLPRGLTVTVIDAIPISGSFADPASIVERVFPSPDSGPLPESNRPPRG